MTACPSIGGSPSPHHSYDSGVVGLKLHTNHSKEIGLVPHVLLLFPFVLVGLVQDA